MTMNNALRSASRLISSSESLLSRSMNSILIGSQRSSKPIIVIDNYDSFTYNLCKNFVELGCNFEVYRNDELTVEELKRKKPRGVVISPGPGASKDFGISLQTVLELGPVIPLLGIRMGLQCIGEPFGGKIVRSPYGVMHGKSSLVYYDEKGEDGLFANLSNPFTAVRYHSLVIEKDSFPSDQLEITAWTEDGLIMAARHKKFKHLQGVQFHPESFKTTEGKTIVRNFIKMVERSEAESRMQCFTLFCYSKIARKIADLGPALERLKSGGVSKNILIWSSCTLFLDPKLFCLKGFYYLEKVLTRHVLDMTTPISLHPEDAYLKVT